jgi:hypothetical protein
MRQKFTRRAIDVELACPKLWRLAGGVVFKRIENDFALAAFACAYVLWAPLMVIGFMPAQAMCRLLAARMREIITERTSHENSGTRRKSF